MEVAYQKQGYLLEDFRLFSLNSNSGERTEYHYHEFCKLLLLHNGSGNYWIEEKRYALQPGDLVLIDSGCVHRPDFPENAPYQRTILYISPEFLDRVSTPDCDLRSCFSKDRGCVLRPDKTVSQQLQLLAQQLQREMAEKKYGSRLLCTGTLSRILVEIGRLQRRGDAVSQKPIQPQNPHVTQILKYIDDHLTENLGIDELARECYLSKYHMMRLFQLDTGLSIYAYITQKRLILAKSLAEQGLSATECCFRCGFGSYSSFTRAYGKFFGTTPTGRPLQKDVPL